jgi:putative FmdB family regulatory protein
MPLYTYQCEACGVRFDARQKFSDDPITECPECGGHTHRVPQPVGIVFKGKGWYSTDSKGRSNLAVPPAKDSADGKAKKPAGDDTKSAQSDTGDTGSGTSAKPDANTSSADSGSKSTN